jgi:hypothetical protein
MIVTYFRSSSYNCWSMCPFQYFLGYTLGLRPDDQNGWTIPKPQWKADLGNVVHKGLELLARKKLASQRGEATFSEDEIGKSWPTATFSREVAFQEAWDLYTKVRAPHWPWSATEYRKCRQWMWSAMDDWGGMFNPLNMTIVQPEQYFDFVIDEPWARYAYTLPDGRRLEGQLALKGTVDLIAEENPETLHYTDWKTGMRKDWATGKPKDWRKLRDDPQLRLYHYALSRLYPDRKHIIITIVFIQDGGPFSLDFGPQDLPKTEKMIRERFETIRDCERPSRIWKHPDNPGQFKCKKLCAYGMNHWNGGRKTVCDHVHDDLLKVGMDKVVAKYAKADAFSSYGEGGGRAAQEGK